MHRRAALRKPKRDGSRHCTSARAHERSPAPVQLHDEHEQIHCRENLRGTRQRRARRTGHRACVARPAAPWRRARSARDGMRGPPHGSASSLPGFAAVGAARAQLLAARARSRRARAFAPLSLSITLRRRRRRDGRCRRRARLSPAPPRACRAHSATDALSRCFNRAALQSEEMEHDRELLARRAVTTLGEYAHQRPKLVCAERAPAARAARQACAAAAARHTPTCARAPQTPLRSEAARARARGARRTSRTSRCFPRSRQWPVAPYAPCPPARGSVHRDFGGQRPQTHLRAGQDRSAHVQRVSATRQNNGRVVARGERCTHRCTARRRV